MPKFTQTTASSPLPASRILAGDGHLIIDRPIAPNQSLVVGQVVAVLSATEQFVALDETTYEMSLAGNGETLAFDLEHDSVDAASVEVEGAAAFTIVPGAGAAGVDQIVFDTAPADAVAVSYRRTSARPAGVMYEAVETGENESYTAAVVQTGSVLADELTGVPAGLVKGMALGGLILE